MQHGTDTAMRLETGCSRGRASIFGKFVIYHHNRDQVRNPCVLVLSALLVCGSALQHDEGLSCERCGVCFTL